MDESDYWLLDLAVELRHRIGRLARDTNGVLYPDDHGHSPCSLLDPLDRLFRAGYLSADPVCGSDCEEEQARRVVDGRVLDRPTIEAALNGTGEDFYYGLTALGGACWEARYRPDWDRYLDVFYSEKGWIRGTDRRRVGELLRRYTASCGSEPDHVRWQDLTPWQVTYWKLLPAGYEVGFEWQDWLDGAPIAGLGQWLSWYDDDA